VGPAADGAETSAKATRGGRADAARDLRVETPPPGARDWTARAKALERDLLRDWTTGAAVAAAHTR
jgi:hypothetical protein